MDCFGAALAFGTVLNQWARSLYNYGHPKSLAKTLYDRVVSHITDAVTGERESVNIDKRTMLIIPIPIAGFS